MRRRVAITGIGAVTPVGNDRETAWEALLAGKSGIGPLTTFDTSTAPVKIGGLVRDFELADHVPSRRLRRMLNRAAGFGVVAAAEAVADADLSAAGYAPAGVGIAMGSNPSRLPIDEFGALIFNARDHGGGLVAQAPVDVVRRNQNTAVAVIAQAGAWSGPTLTVNTACAASLHSVGEAARRIQDGDAMAMIAGGYDALTGYLDVTGFTLVGALTTDHQDEPWRASRPFDRDRSGFVIGEGAVILVLEELEAAQRRGARIYAEIAGYRSTLNAYRITDSPPDGSGAIQAMRGALKEAGASVDEVACVVAHGTSTPGNDASETRAIKAVFGEAAYRLAITAPKSMTGHLCDAAGALNLMVGALAIRDGRLPPTINLEQRDPELDLDYTPGVARGIEVETAVVNAFAFGGTNGSILLRGLA